MRSLFRKSFLKLRKLVFLDKKIFILFLSFLFLGVILITVGILRIKIAELPYPKFGGVYKEGLFEPLEPLNLIKINDNNISQKSFLNILFPPFIEFDNGNIISKFFNYYKVSSDNLSYTFYLKNNLKWSDGRFIDSDDFLFSFDLFKKSNPGFLDKIEISFPDKKTVIFKLPTNNNYFIYNLKNFRIFPKQLISLDSLSQVYLKDLKVSSGPFVFENSEIKNDRLIVSLRKNPYFQPQPYLDQIFFYVYSSARKAFDALILKEIDGLGGINYFSLPSNVLYTYNIYNITMPRIVGIFFNKPQSNLEMIEFLDKSINRRELADKVFKSYAEISDTIFSPTLRKIFFKDNKQQNALSFSSTLGTYKTTSTLNLIVDSSYFYPDIARYLQEKFDFIKIQFVDKNNLNRIIADKKYVAILSGLFFDHFPNLSFFSSASFNINNYQSLDLEKKLQQLLEEPNINLFQELNNLEHLILNLRSNIFLINPYYLYFVNKSFYNFDQNYLFDASARFVKIEQWFKK